MNNLKEIFEAVGDLPQDFDRTRLWPDRDHVVRCAKVVSKLEPLSEWEEGNYVYRGTLLHRVIGGVRNGVWRVIGNEPTEYAPTLHATRLVDLAASYATSYFPDALAPVDKRIDPVVLVFDAEELADRIGGDQGLRWHIPKNVIAECDVKLAFPGRDAWAKSYKEEWDF